ESLLMSGIMKQTICNQVRIEIDEKDFTESLSTQALGHLRHCSDCQEFQSKETKLRQIIGSLETVNAPADFDFRLRARLANDRTASSYLSMSPVRVWRMRSAAVAAMLVIFAATIYMVRQNQPIEPQRETRQAANATVTPIPADSPTAPADVASVPTREDPADSASGRDSRPRRQLAAPSKRQVVAVDLSGRPAPVVSTDQTFSLEFAQPSYKVSLDDGSGSARTISVPAVTFGSRRLLNTNTTPVQYAPKADW
ncbi:MAG TPA: hypothetical protein VF251_09480, partial [Pyrinomonadaceae bacterium]